ncbi:MAG TPA: heme-binding protein [Vicinamibacterales bacterium]
MTRKAGRALVLTVMALAFVADDVRAQGATPVPLAKVILSGEAAKRTLTKVQINAATARAIVDACVEFGRANNASYSVFVLAPTGEIVDAHVMDGQVPIGVETAMLKAKTVLYARTSSGAVAQRFSTVDGRVIRLDLGKETGLAYYFVPGGLPIVVEDQLIGAIGVGGGNMDEQCAHQALTKVLGPQPPLTPPPTK